MHQLFRGLDAKPDNSHQQKNHGVEFVSGVLPEALQSCLLDCFDLLVNEAEMFDVTPKRCSCVGWQRASLGRSHVADLLSRFAQNWFEVAHSELRQNSLHLVNRPGSLFDQ